MTGTLASNLSKPCQLMKLGKEKQRRRAVTNQQLGIQRAVRAGTQIEIRKDVSAPCLILFCSTLDFEIQQDLLCPVLSINPWARSSKPIAPRMQSGLFLVSFSYSSFWSSDILKQNLTSKKSAKIRSLTRTRLTNANCSYFCHFRNLANQMSRTLLLPILIPLFVIASIPWYLGWIKWNLIQSLVEGSVLSFVLLNWMITLCKVNSFQIFNKFSNELFWGGTF